MDYYPESTTALTLLVTYQAKLLDHSGHVTRGLSRDDARIYLDEIQRLREKLGWPPLDMTGRWKRQRRA